jgi:hypothetical protein
LRFPNARFLKNGTPRSRVTFHARISPFSMVPKKFPTKDQNLQRRRPPREDQSQTFLTFFQYCANLVSRRSDCSDIPSQRDRSGKLARRFGVKPFFIVGIGLSVYRRPRLQATDQTHSSFFFLLISCALVRRATSFRFQFFFLGNEAKPEGTVPPIVGSVEG